MITRRDWARGLGGVLAATLARGDSDEYLRRFGLVLWADAIDSRWRSMETWLNANRDPESPPFTPCSIGVTELGDHKYIFGLWVWQGVRPSVRLLPVEQTADHAYAREDVWAVGRMLKADRKVNVLYLRPRHGPTMIEGEELA